jgi:hypothetical protein
MKKLILGLSMAILATSFQLEAMLEQKVSSKYKVSTAEASRQIFGETQSKITLFAAHTGCLSDNVKALQTSISTCADTIFSSSTNAKTFVKNSEAAILQSAAAILLMYGTSIKYWVLGFKTLYEQFKILLKTGNANEQKIQTSLQLMQFGSSLLGNAPITYSMLRSVASSIILEIDRGNYSGNYSEGAKIAGALTRLISAINGNGNDINSVTSVIENAIALLDGTDTRSINNPEMREVLNNCKKLLPYARKSNKLFTTFVIDLKDLPGSKVKMQRTKLLIKSEDSSRRSADLSRGSRDDFGIEDYSRRGRQDASSTGRFGDDRSSSLSKYKPSDIPPFNSSRNRGVQKH